MVVFGLKKCKDSFEMEILFLGQNLKIDIDLAPMYSIAVLGGHCSSQ